MPRLLLLFLLPLFLASSPPEPKKLPDFRLSSLEGEEIDLAELSEPGPFLLDFWATWCLPCRQAFPAYAKLQEKYAEQGFRVITVNQDEPSSQRAIAPLMRRLKIDFPVLLDPELKLGDELGVLNLPTSFLVDAEGRVVWTHRGYLPGDERLVEAELLKLLESESD